MGFFHACIFLVTVIDAWDPCFPLNGTKKYLRRLDFHSLTFCLFVFLKSWGDTEADIKLPQTICACRLTHKCTPAADLKQNKSPKCAYRAISHLEVGKVGGVGKSLLGDLLQAAVLRLLFQASLKQM